MSRIIVSVSEKTTAQLSGAATKNFISFGRLAEELGQAVGLRAGERIVGFEITSGGISAIIERY